MGRCIVWADVSCIPESGCCCLFVTLFFHFSFSNFHILKFFVTLFLGTLRPRRLKHGTHMDSGQIYRVPESGCCFLFVPLFIFFPPNFQTLKFFVIFLRKCEALKVETWYIRGQWDQAAAAYSSLCFFIFLSFQFSTLKYFVTLFSGTVKP